MIEKINRGKYDRLPLLEHEIVDLLDTLVNAVNTLMENHYKNCGDMDCPQSTGCCMCCTICERKEVKEEWPKDGDEYFNISTDGDVVSEIWEDAEFDRDVRDFLGIYKTREECEEAIKRIKELLTK